MANGISRRVVVVDSPDPQIFEQAIFIIRNDAVSGTGGAPSQQVVDQAIRIARNYAHTHSAPPGGKRGAPPWLWSLAGAAAIGLVWLTVVLI